MPHHFLEIGQPRGMAARGNHPARREPLQIYRQYLDQEQADKKGRQRHCGKDSHHHQRIEPGVLLIGRDHANNNRNHPG
ncbi:hypothetical protein D3C87_1699230 [compost metagenome]